jgi:putative transposase
MGRPRRADEAGGIYHAWNRGNARATVFPKPEDYEAFERILAEGLERQPCRILAYQLMPNHWHLVLQPTEDGGMSSFLAVGLADAHDASAGLSVCVSKVGNGQEAPAGFQ